MTVSNPKVFVSYSWAIQERVREFVNRLFENGIDVIVDFYDLKPGQDKYSFMERSVSDKTIDKVLIICDKTYCDKADQRAGGVGDETVIITPQVYGNCSQEKFIPVVFECDENGKEYLPSYIKSRIFINLSNENYEDEYEKLLRLLYNQPLYQKPELGSKPHWLDSSDNQYVKIHKLLIQIQYSKETEGDKISQLLSQIKDELVLEAQKYQIPFDSASDEAKIIATINSTLDFRNAFVELCVGLLRKGISMHSFFTSMFEQMNCELYTIPERKFCKNEFVVFHYILWEFFILATAILLHFEKYSDLRELILHTYFVKDCYRFRDVNGDNYVNIQKNISLLTEAIERTRSSKRKLSLVADILNSRGDSNILKKEEIINADIVLYQLSRIHFNNIWEPITYVYDKYAKQIIWKKLVSKQFCNKVLPLFDVKDITVIPVIISQSSNRTQSFQFAHSDKAAPWFTDSIEIDRIGTLY